MEDIRHGTLLAKQAVDLLGDGFLALRATVQTALATIASLMLKQVRRIMNIVGAGVEGMLRIWSKLPGPMGAPFRKALADVIRARAGINKQLDALQGRINRLHGRTLYFRGVWVPPPGMGSMHSIVGGYAHGGIVGGRGAGVRPMQAGGIGGAATALVGEQGPELVRLPVGSTVKPAGETRRALAGAEGGRPSEVRLVIDSGGSRMDDLLVELLRKAVRSRGGNVQVVLGRG
jgi:hypothetical protein